MKKLLPALSILLFTLSARAQNAQSIDVNMLQPLNFNYYNAEELTMEKTIYSALELKLKVKQVPAIVSASLNYTSPADPALNGKLSLKYSNGNSSNAVVNMSAMPLSTVPVQLLQQPASGNGADHYVFYYDVILSPITSFFAQENNYFVITFTLANP